MPSKPTYTAQEWEFDAREIANTLLDAVRVYETFSGHIIDPSNPNARDEFRRIAAQKGCGARSYKDVWLPRRKVLDRIVDVLLVKLAERYAAVA